MIGYAASNLAQGLSDSVQWYELQEQLEKGKILLDVRILLSCWQVASQMLFLYHWIAYENAWMNWIRLRNTLLAVIVDCVLTLRSEF